MQFSPSTFVVTFIIAAACNLSAFAQVERVWLTHRSHDPSKVVVSWTTKSPTESLVRFGTSKQLGQEAKVAGTRTLHHVEIPITEKDTTYHYSVGAADLVPLKGTFKSSPLDELRVAVVANWHSKADLTAILEDDVHLLMMAGDNITSLWQRCGEGKRTVISRMPT